MRHASLLDREQRLAGRAIEEEEMAHLRRCDHAWTGTGPGRKIEQDRLGADVVVPDIVMNGLKVPHHLP